MATKLDEFPTYVRRQRITRLLSLYDLFREVVDVKGSIIDCGVFRGFSLSAFAHFSAILEPANLTRRIYGFDTFVGFPSVGPKDLGIHSAARAGQFSTDIFEHLTSLLRTHDQNRYLGRIDKVCLIRGDAAKTIPAFLAENPHVVISLLLLDFDLYEPTRIALEAFLPRMPRGAVIAFDELDNPRWPGETLALLETVGLQKLVLRRFSYDPYIAFARID